MMDLQGEIDSVKRELTRAIEKFPAFPSDPIHAAAIVAEESGELVQACLQVTYEGGTWADVRKEAVHTAAMALRFLVMMDEMVPRKTYPQ